jgi:tetratricopeptide (TPR) repeat protein
MAAVPSPPGPGLGAWVPWLIALLAAALYLGTLRYSFVWDDLALIALNQFVRRLADLPNWLTMTADQASFGHFSGSLYRPGVLVSLALDFRLWGNAAAGFHLTNVLLHALMVGLVYQFVRALSDRKDLAAVVALLFAVHPGHVEAVAWISARGDLWVSICMATAALIYHRFLRAHGWSRARWYGAALAAMGIGLLFKEAAVTLPAVFLLLEALGPKIGAPQAGPWWSALLRSLPFWAIAVGHLVFLSRPLQSYNPGVLTPEVLMTRLPGCLATFARYVGLLVFPVSMRPFYDLPRPTSLMDPWPLAGAGMLVALLALGFLAWRPLPVAAFGLGWFLITVAPYLDLLAISPRTMGLADRYLYGASIGFLLLAAGLLDEAAVRLARPRTLGRTQFLGMATGILALGYIGLTAWYMPVWRDNLSLYSRIVRDFPQAAGPRLNLGTTYLDLGEVDRGIGELQTAVRLRPEWVRPQIPLALALVEFRDPTEGFRIFDRIAATAAGDYFYYVMRGRAHLLVRQPEKAAEVLRAGLRRFPNSLNLLFLLGEALEVSGDVDGAIQAFQGALALDPDLAGAHEGLGRTLAQRGDYAGAARSFTRALELHPNRITALHLLALAQEKAGRVKESLHLWREVAARAPDPGLRAEALRRIQELSAGSGPSHP